MGLKKKLKILGMMLLLVVSVVLGSGYSHHLIQQETKVKVQSKTKEEDTICPIDKDYLLKVGIEPFTSHLPVLMIDTGGQQLAREVESWGKIGIYDNQVDGNNVSGLPDEVLDCTVKLRGASSYSGFDKNQYRIKFYKKQRGKSYNYPLLGMGENSEWVLHGPFLDQTLMRNALCYELASQMMEWAPDSRYVEVFRDGKYEGVYLAVEPVTNGESRLRLCEFGLLSGQTAYILKRDRVGTEENVLQSWGFKNGKTMNELSISYPTNNKLTKRQSEWILNDISKFEEKLYTGNIDYEKEIDINNFVDYFILNEISLNHDAGKLSTYAYKELDGKLKLAVWDFDNAFDNYRWFSMDYDQFETVEAPWFDQLIRDRTFVERLCKRYKEYRQDILSTEKILETLETKEGCLGDAIERNNKIWGYTFRLKMLVQDKEIKRNAESYEEAMAYLKASIEKRLAYMDEHIEDLYQYCGESY